MNDIGILLLLVTALSLLGGILLGEDSGKQELAALICGEDSYELNDRGLFCVEADGSLDKVVH